MTNRGPGDIVWVVLVSLLVGVLLVATFSSAIGLVGATENVEDTTVDPVLENATDERQVVVQLPAPSGATIQSADDPADAMRSHAETTQPPVRIAVESLPGTSVDRSFWLTNALVVTVDLNETNATRLAAVDGVEAIHKNFRYELNGTATASTQANGPDHATRTIRSPSGAATPRSVPDDPTTYGLASIAVSDTWRTFNTTGEGARVAVLDTGVDADHPDIDLYTDDPDDPTFPGGWVAFHDNGTTIDNSEPFDQVGHGTHVSGTVAGGNASDEAIGVAPGSDLMHANVFNDSTSATFAQLQAGYEWAIDNDADVISLSLGVAPDSESVYLNADVQLVEQAREAGLVVVAASGNSGEGLTGSPGNIYDVFSVGATDNAGNVPSFSSGEVVDTEDAWGDDALAHWPEEYVVPDVTAPGVEIRSTEPGGVYATRNGTSMATPHVSGAVGLLLSIDPSASEAEVFNALTTTAVKPDGQPAGQDTRYGHGVIDVHAAGLELTEQGELSGTITDPDGNPVANATVTVGSQTVTTNDDGTYSMVLKRGDYSATVSAFGFADESQNVSVSQLQTSLDVTLDPTLAVALQDTQPVSIERGESFELRFSVANVETYDVAVGKDSDITRDAVDISIDGTPVENEARSFSDPRSGAVTVTVSPTDLALGNLTLNHSFGGLDEEIEIMTGPTDVRRAIDDGEVVLGISPREVSTPSGGESEFNVVVYGPDAGVSGYNLSVDVANTSVATFDSATAAGDTDPTITANGSTVLFNGLVDEPSTDAYMVGTVTVTANSSGQTDLTISNDASVGATDGSAYVILDTENATVSVEKTDGVDVTGDGRLATDTTGDALLNDVNGDGRFNVLDVSAFFQNFQNDAVQTNEELFDFNHDGRVNILDVSALFKQLSEE